MGGVRTQTARRERVERMAQCALLGALALVLSYIETMIPLPFTVPGIKLGLANAAVLVALLLLDARSAAGIALVKVLASGFLFGSPTMLAYSAGGTLLALLAMLLLSKISGMDTVPISMASAIFHNVGQLAVAAFMLGTPAVFMTLPVLAVAACVTGAIIGGASQGVVAALQADELAERVPVDLSGFELRPGEHVAFVGANGSGKSTAALQLAGLLEDAAAVADDGARTVANGAADGVAGAEAVRLVMQDPASQLVKNAVEDDVAFGPENLGLSLPQMRELVADALADAGVQSLAQCDVNELSGGQGQQTAIAGVLAMRPRAIVFDEASSMLDTAARARFQELIARLCAAGVAVVTVTQLPDEALAADRAVLFKAGKIVFSGDPAKAVAQLDGEDLAAFGHGAEEGQSEEATAAVVDATGFGDAADGVTAPDAGRALTCSNLRFAYPGSSVSVLQGVSLSVQPGRVLGLKGVCGCGKSTLGRLLAGYELPLSGCVQVDGLELRDERAARDAFRHRVAYVEQRPERALFAQTAFDDVLFGARNLGLSEDEACARAAAALEAVGIDPVQAREKNPFCYSGGEQRRIALAGMLVLETPYLILDEPSAGLDPEELRRLAALVARLRAEGRGIVLIAHDDVFLNACCDDMFDLGEHGGAGASAEQGGSLRGTASLAMETLGVQQLAARPLPARFGRYCPKDSFVHALDPRVKIALCLLYMVAGFVAQGWAALGLVAVFGVAMLLAAKTTPHQAWGAFRPFLGLMIFVGVFDALFTGGNSPWWQAGPLALSAESLSFAAESVLRFALVAVTTSTLMATTSATQLSDGCAALLEPLRACGARVDDAALSLAMTLRFVPLVQGEFFTVKQAQEARLANFNSAHLAQRVRAYGPVFVPLFAGCLRRSQDLALAIQNRAYGSSAKRGHYRTFELRVSDVFALLLVAALFAAVIALRAFA